MIAIAVDDEPLMLGALCKAVSASDDITAVTRFSGCSEALEWVAKNHCDVAFLDINMRGMGGLELAKKITELRPECRIVFCTGYEEYALSAFKLHAAGYLLKPISAEDVQEEIDNIKNTYKKEKALIVKCFGTFEVFAKGEKLNFKRSKTKEMFAYLIDRQGAGVTAAEIGAVLWEGDVDGKYQNYLHQLSRDLRMTLEDVGAEDVFLRNNHTYSIDPDRIECDYYSYLKSGSPGFYGEYMVQYSWAEETCGLLWRKA